MRRLAALSAAALLGLCAVPALAADPEPVFLEQAVWFHDGGSKLGNLALVDASANPATFDTKQPTASVTGGAGGGHYADIASEIALGDYNGASGPTFTGTFTGDLDRLDVNAYAAAPATANGAALSIRHQLIVDGTALYSSATADDVRTVAGGQAAKIGQWRYTGLHAAMKDAGLATGPDVKHEVVLKTLVFFVGDDTVFLYDSTEVPSGMVFNDDAALAGRTVFDLTPPPVEEF